MHLLGQTLLALSAANVALGYGVFYEAKAGQNPGTGTKGCTGARVDSVTQQGAGVSDCIDVGQAACVQMVDHTGDATKCKVLLWSEVGCPRRSAFGEGEDDSNIFGQDGEYSNDNFASFKAVCS